MASESGKSFPFHNVGLFSDNFLSKRLPAESPLWSSKKAAAETAFDKILAQYNKFTSTYKSPNEAQTEDDFTRPVLNILDYAYIVQTPLKHKGKFNQPDYSLFADEKTKKEAGSLKVKEQEAFYSKALAICDAKYWGRPLDIKLTDKKDTFTNINPSFQIVNYLVGANVDWGILTNGKLWRLYYQKASSRSSNFYEVDLEELLLKGDLEVFLYFYLFFRKEAFLKDFHGKSFPDQVLEGSTHYATELSDRLKDKVFDEIFPHLARGFLRYRKTELGIQTETEETLKEIYNAALTLLYRLLFILYAEDRNLLPIREPNYFRYSLAQLKQRVAEARDKKITLSELSTDLWSDLETLFRIIDVGDPKLNVPTYNGGLFSHKNRKNDFLKTNKVPDPWLALALDRLTREEDKETGKPQFIDYSELEVRHLGSIYEGLLEFHLKIAEEDKAVVKEKEREIYKPVAEVRNPKEIVKKGDLYIENDKHERKSTGSYYTPDYIVKYIVQNAVGPVLEEKLKNMKKLFTEIASLSAKAKRATVSRAARTDYLKAKKQQATDELFSLKVLDPAMGSGHFLVETVDFLSDHIIKFLNDHPDNPILEAIESVRSTILDDLKKKGIQIDEQKLTPTNLVKRMVMKRCIYGVDLNPMAVELAKLSLWLHSFTLGAPLSFLDHHLKCGNSLIGTTVKTVKGSMEEVKVKEEGRYVDWEGREKVVPEQKALYLFGSQFAGLLSATELMRQVGELTDSTFEEVQESQEKYEKAADALKPFKLILDLWTSKYFGNEDAQRFLTHGGNVEAFLKSNGHVPEKIRKLREETENLSQAKRFFHWELEFPEVFYEGGREQQNPGFGAVIGNPPYGLIKDKHLRKLCELNFKSTQYQPDHYVVFTEQGVMKSRLSGRTSYIVPTTFIGMHYFSRLREFLLRTTHIHSLCKLCFPVFEEATVESAIFVVERPEPQAVDGDFSGCVYTFETEEQFVNQTREPTAFKRSQLLQSEDYDFTYLGLKKEAALVDKLKQTSINLGTICELTIGVKPYQVGKGTPKQTREVVEKRVFDSANKKDSTFRRYLVGRDINRYTVCPEEDRWISYGDWLAEPRPSAPFFDPVKILVRQTADQIIATIDTDRFATLNNIHNLRLTDKHLKYSYVLTILNAKISTFFHRTMVGEAGRIFAEVKLVDLEKLPIRRTNFTTPEKQRNQLREKGMTLYERCLAKNDFLCVTGFVDNCLKQKPEQADVLHDLLALLAERMIEMNKEKQAEVKGFLEWLEREIGTKIDSLKNNLKIRAYHEGSFEDLIEILKENRKAFNVDPSRREFQDKIKTEFDKSLAKLTPLKARIVTTDRLIDLIVYRLYGLTEEEVKIVEGKAE